MTSDVPGTQDGPKAAAEVDAARTEALRSGQPFADVLGLEVLESTKERVRIRTWWAPERCTARGILHGGFLMAVADAAGGTLTGHHLPEGAGTTTIESKTNFIRGVTEGAIIATAEPLHAGRSTVVVTTQIHDEQGRLVSQTTQTQMVLLPR